MRMSAEGPLCGWSDHRIGAADAISQQSINWLPSSLVGVLSRAVYCIEKVSEVFVPF
jgi:hypothetical protein